MLASQQVRRQSTYMWAPWHMQVKVFPGKLQRPIIEEANDFGQSTSKRLYIRDCDIEQVTDSSLSPLTLKNETSGMYTGAQKASWLLRSVRKSWPTQQFLYFPTVQQRFAWWQTLLSPRSERWSNSSLTKRVNLCRSTPAGSILHSSNRVPMIGSRQRCTRPSGTFVTSSKAPNFKISRRILSIQRLLNQPIILSGGVHGNYKGSTTYSSDS